MLGIRDRLAVSPFPKVEIASVLQDKYEVGVHLQRLPILEQGGLRLPLLLVGGPAVAVGHGRSRFPPQRLVEIPERLLHVAGSVVGDAPIVVQARPPGLKGERRVVVLDRFGILPQVYVGLRARPQDFPVLRILPQPDGADLNRPPAVALDGLGP
jgi:hypothetical protein